MTEDGADELFEPDYPAAFRAAVRRELEDQGFAIADWAGDGLDYVDPSGQTGYLGLSNLFRRYATADPDDTDRVVRDFLANVLHSGATRANVPDRLEDVLRRVLVRIGKPFTGVEKVPWAKKLPGTGLLLNLVIDFPSFMTYVTPEQIDRSDDPPGDWVDQALENLKDRTPVDWLEVLHADSGILAGHLNDSYDAARALILSDIVDTPAGGWLVAIPTRDWLFCRPVTADGLAHFHLLKILAERNFATEPYPISDGVFWVRGHKWEPFPVEIDGETVKLTPPDGFLDAIGGPPGGEIELA